MASSVTKSKFRNINNVRILKGLFLEDPKGDTPPLYTLQEQDQGDIPSLHRLYKETGDVTEYVFAEKYFESFEHWEMVCNCTWFAPYISAWRKELETKIRSEALANIIQESKSPKSKNSFSASKFLVEKGWQDKSTKGRPSKTDIRKAASEKAEENLFVEEAYSRLKGLHVQ